MRLLDEMFVLVSDDGRQMVLRLNAAHPIYQLHFPGTPITPGLCLVKMLGELLERKTGSRLELKKIVNLKFIRPLSPEKSPLLTVVFDSLETIPPLDREGREGAVCAKGIITANEQVATKFSLHYGTHPCN